MRPPSQILENADLLAYAAVPASVRFTGRLQLFADGDRVGRVSHLAICRLHEEGGLLLLHCDKSWNIVGVQVWNAPGVEPIVTVEAMKMEIEGYYEGLMPSWKEAVGNG